MLIIIILFFFVILHILLHLQCTVNSVHTNVFSLCSVHFFGARRSDFIRLMYNAKKYDDKAEVERIKWRERVSREGGKVESKREREICIAHTVIQCAISVSVDHIAISNNSDTHTSDITHTTCSYPIPFRRHWCTIRTQRKVRPKISYKLLAVVSNALTSSIIIHHIRWPLITAATAYEYDEWWCYSFCLGPTKWN